MKGTPGQPGGPRSLASPTLGEHTREILEDLGYDDGGIADFERRQIINTRGPVNIEAAMAALREPAGGGAAQAIVEPGQPAGSGHRAGWEE